jgi:1,4-dihydroxy-6-naphthoate synthase
MTKIIRVGHTPDMDDAFMFYGIISGAVALNGFRFDHVIEDIQTLNRRALGSELDVTAISVAAYPQLADRYWLLSVGASVGRGYGPLLIAAAPRTAEDLAGKRIAVPGLQTTASLLLRLAIPNFTPVEMSFEAIPGAGL